MSPTFNCKGHTKGLISALVSAKHHLLVMVCSSSISLISPPCGDLTANDRSSPFPLNQGSVDPKLNPSAEASHDKQHPTGRLPIIGIIPFSTPEKVGKQCRAIEHFHRSIKCFALTSSSGGSDVSSTLLWGRAIIQCIVMEPKYLEYRQEQHIHTGQEA